MEIIVFPHSRVRAWAPDRPADAVEVGRRLNIPEFFAPQPTDAMAVAWDVPGLPQPPRLTKAVGDILAGEGHPPQLRWALLDFDREGHTPWTSLEEARAAFLAAVTKLRLATGVPPAWRANVGGYTTRAGFRLMWHLSSPLNYTLAEDFLSRLGEAVSQAVGWAADSAAMDWTRLFRLPRATRDGQLLESAGTYPVQSVEPDEWGWDLAAVATSAPAQPWSGDLPEPTWAQRAHAANFPWLLRGDAPPAADTGSLYETMRSTLAAVAASGNFTDPALLLALARDSWESAGRDLDELVRLAEWVAGQEATALPDPETPVTLPKHSPPSLEDWAEVEKVLGKRGNDLSNLRDGLAFGATTRVHEAGLLRLARKLAAGGIGDPLQLFNVLYASAQEGRAPLPDVLWARCQDLCEEYGEVFAAKAANKNLGRAFCAIHPLFLGLPGSSARFILDTSQEPYSYHRTDRDTILAQARDGFKDLPFVPEVREGDSPRQMAALLADYGNVVTSICYQSGQEGAIFDARSNTLLEGVHALDKELTPCRHPLIEEWLRRLMPTDEDLELLLDWLSAVPMTAHEPIAALYLDGPSGCGKSLLGAGIARLWGPFTKPSDYALVSARFNAGLLACPLVFADEGITVAPSEHYQASELFRTLVAGRQHRVEHKGIDETHLRAALRVLITANGVDGIPFRKALDADGLQAIVERVIYLRIPRAQEVGDKGVKAWLNEQAPSANGWPKLIAEHILWLYNTRAQALLKAPRRGRFLVTGTATPWHKNWAARQGWKALVLEAVDKLLRKSSPSLFIRFDHDAPQVLVHPNSLYESWASVMAQGRAPTREQVSETLRQMADNITLDQVRFGPQGRRKRVWRIGFAHFLETGVWDEAPTNESGTWLVP